jgi:tetratricopeptide (TPR) repeat protein
MAILEAALRANPKDARALYYLGNLLYDRRRHEEALSLWQRSSEVDPSFPTVWRNLGIAYFNVAKDPEKALFAFEQALAADPQDARILDERDQLWKRTGKPPRERLRELERFSSLVPLRDDLSAEIAALYNDTGQPELALAVLSSRKFQPWEGGEGVALGQHVRAYVMLGRRALVNERFDNARQYFEQALTSPENLGEAQHLLANRSNVYYWLGVAYESAGGEASARHWWQRAAASKGDFQQMSVKRFSEMSFYSGKALQRLGAQEQAEQFFRDLLRYARQLAGQKATIDYFATSLPHLLLFDEDPDRTAAILSKFLEAQAKIGLSEPGGERLLHEVLAADPNHQMALDFRDEIRSEHILQGAG